MLANYGFEDASGAYYIQIDTEKCAQCIGRGCTRGCPMHVFELCEDDYDDVVAAVRDFLRDRINSICAACKQLDARSEMLPCQLACGRQAITHSW